MKRAAAALALCSVAAFAQGKFTWEVPGQIGEAVVVPETLHALGVPVRVQAVRTRTAPPELVEFYLRRFIKAGLWVPPRRDVPPVSRELSVTALDPATLISYTVILQPNPDGTTTVILGEANVGQRASPNGAAFAPVFPGAKAPLISEQEGLRTMAYAAPAAPQEVLGFYRDVLVKDGYREVEPGTFSRGEEQLRIDARAAGERRALVTVIGSRSPFQAPAQSP